MSRTTRFVPPAPTKYAFPAIVLFSYLTAHSREFPCNLGATLT